MHLTRLEAQLVAHSAMQNNIFQCTTTSCHSFCHITNKSQLWKPNQLHNNIFQCTASYHSLCRITNTSHTSQRPEAQLVTQQHLSMQQCKLPIIIIYAILQKHHSSLLWLLLLTFDIHECMLEHIKTCRPCNGANQMQDAAENARKSENAKMQLLCNELGPAGPL